MRYCTYCGSEVNDYAVVCLKCGGQVNRRVMKLMLAVLALVFWASLFQSFG